MLALWPISVFLGARLLSLERWPAAAAALVSPLIVSVTGYGFEHSSYTWQGLGVYTQLWGMWLLPLVWGLTYRAVTRGGKWYAPAALVLALTIATHLMTGYLAVLSIGVWVVLARRGFLRRVGRAAIVAVGGLATAAWVLVPLLADRNYSAQTAYYKGTIFDDSYGAGKILHWLFTGELFDHSRFPIFSLLVAVGFVVCVIRVPNVRSRARGARHLDAEPPAVLRAGHVGRAVVVNLLPGNGDLQMHRFMEGVDLAAIFSPGVGLVAVARLGRLRDRPRARVVPGPVGLGSARRRVGDRRAPRCWHARARVERGRGTTTRTARPSSRASASTRSRRRRLRRPGAGGGATRRRPDLRRDRADWGTNYRIGSVPAFVELENYDADAIGYPFRTVQSLSTDVDASFDETNPSQYQIMNIKYMILPEDMRRPFRRS